MKRLVLVLCLCGLLAVPAMAAAGAFAPDNEFQGRVEGDPNTYFGFDLGGHGRHHKVRHVTAALPMACYSGDQGIVEVSLPGAFKVTGPRGLLITVSQGGSAAHAKAGHHRHHLKLFIGDANVDTPNGSGTAEIFGLIQRHGKALGYIRVQTRSDSLGKCYSGYLDWKVKRGADVVYPPA